MPCPTKFICKQKKRHDSAWGNHPESTPDVNRTEGMFAAFGRIMCDVRQAAEAAGLALGLTKSKGRSLNQSQPMVTVPRSCRVHTKTAVSHNPLVPDYQQEHL